MPTLDPRTRTAPHGDPLAALPSAPPDPSLIDWLLHGEREQERPTYRTPFGPGRVLSHSELCQGRVSDADVWATWQDSLL